MFIWRRTRGNAHTVGLKSDGTVAAVGWNKHDQCDVNNWCDIVAVAAGWGRTIGLKLDGSVVAVGRNNEGECNVSGWRGIQMPDN
jgi:alpha-tubulin suppressor-like RCC1 family protein